MRTPARQSGLRPTAIVIALLAAFSPAHAQTSEAKPAEAKPAEAPAEASTKSMQASVSVGGAWASGDSADRAFFGQYNGMRDQSVYGLLDFDYRRADSADGSSTGLIGTNLGLQTRELLFYWERQGDWKFTADYGELLRRDLYTVNTGLVRAGSQTPQVVHLPNGPGTGGEYDPSTKRKGLGLGFSKWFGQEVELVASLKSENKDGSRIFGIGMNCPSTVAFSCGATTLTQTGSAILLLPEPIESNHTQAELRLNYAGERLRLTGGYYGSFYNNSNATMAAGIPGSLNNQLGTLLPLSNGLQGILGNPVALPPDNQSQTLDLAGNYTFTPSTRANFKVAYSQAKQDQGWAGTGLNGAPVGVSNLDGQVNTTLAQVGLISRPIARLTLQAEGRYEDRNDKTPIAYYNAEGSSTWTNRSYSLERIRGKLQATYQFSSAYVGIAAVDYDAIDRATFTPTSAVSGVSALRQDTDETTWRLELKRRMTENFSGEIRFTSSDRNGSNWLRPTSGGGVTEVTDPSTFPATAIFAPTLADRRRDQLKLQANWQPSDALLLVASAAGGKDDYSMPTQYALQDSKMSLFTLDANYALSDAWSLNGFASYGTQKLNQARPAGSILAFDNTNLTLGFGATGRISEQIEVGGTLAYISDNNEYAQTLDALANPSSGALLAATGGLPDIKFQQTELRLYGKYALAKNQALRLDAIYQQTKYNDWAYQYGSLPYTYSDNTTVTLDQNQSVVYIGISYVYSWR
jgi:MtrB/PioB family decaheme-associated outer membrane protein